MFLYTAALHAQGSQWSVNINDYQYDMTVYAQILDDDVAVTDYSNLEVAAFVGDECRGIAQVQSTVKDDVTYRWLYIRVRSNSNSGEEVSFKVYDKTLDKVFKLAEKVPFTSQGSVGLPSNPQDLSKVKYTLGDVNEDDKINIADVTAILSYMAGNPPAVFNESAADANEDNKINIADATRILSIMAGN